MPRPLSNYPSSIGAVAISVFPHVGPASYAVLAVPVAGTIPITLGDTIQAGPESGLKNFDVVLGGITDDGAFEVEVIPVTVSNPATGNRSGVPSTTYKAKWISRVTAVVGGQAQVAGTEATATTDLSAECVRLVAFGV